jgi:hypothetical protein
MEQELGWRTPAADWYGRRWAYACVPCWPVVDSSAGVLLP